MPTLTAEGDGVREAFGDAIIRAAASAVMDQAATKPLLLYEKSKAFVIKFVLNQAKKNVSRAV